MTAIRLFVGATLGDGDGDGDGDAAVPAHGRTAVPADGSAAAPTRADATAPRGSDATVPTRGDAPAPRRSDAPAPRRSDATSPRRSDAPSPRRGDATSPRRGDAPAPRRGDAPSPRRGGAAVPDHRAAMLLQPGRECALPPGAVRHAQVRRVQPGDALLLFDGNGSDWPAVVLAVGRSSVRVQLGQPQPVPTELPLAVTLAVVMPANERMDALVEKATELGAARLQPLLSERSVLRLAGERAERKRGHWQAIAQAACAQCGRARVPVLAPVLALADWLHGLPPQDDASCRLLLSLRADARPLPQVGALALPSVPRITGVTALSGPEGGWTADEEDAARQHGFTPVTLGPRVLRADTAPLALLAWLAAQAAA